MRAKYLSSVYGVEPGGQHYFHKDGNWYHVLDRFPGVYWDNYGYIVFRTIDAYRNCSQLSIKKTCHVAGGDKGKGISDISGYVRIEGMLTAESEAFRVTR